MERIYGLWQLMECVYEHLFKIKTIEDIKSVDDYKKKIIMDLTAFVLSLRIEDKVYEHYEIELKHSLGEIDEIDTFLLATMRLLKAYNKEDVRKKMDEVVGKIQQLNEVQQLRVWEEVEELLRKENYKKDKEN